MSKNNILFIIKGINQLYNKMHGLRTTNEGINQRYLKCADVADIICFGRT